MTANPERLVHGLQYRFEFAAQVGGVDGAESCQLFGQLHDFVRGRRKRAGICQARGQSQRTGLQALAQLFAHRGNFAGRGGAIQIVEMVAAQCGVAHQRGDVQRRVRRFDRRAVIAERRINKGGAAAQQVHRVRRIAAQTHRRSTDAAVADDHRGHPLAELGQHLRLADHHGVVMGVHVDETRRQHATGGVDLLGGAGVVQVADALDATVQYRQVGGVAGAVAAIDDQRVANQRVVHHLSLPTASDHRRRGHRPGRV